MAPSEPDPRDVVVGEEAEGECAGDVCSGKDEGGCAGTTAECDGGDHAAKCRERDDGFEGGAVGVASNAAIGGLQELFELSEEDRDAEVEDDPLGVVFADVRQLQKVGCGKKVKRSDEQNENGGADEDDEPPAALEDTEGVFAVVACDHHGHLVACDVAEPDATEVEIGGDGVEDEPLAEERRVPEVEEDGHLDELNDGGGEPSDPVDDEAKEEPPLCVTIHAHSEVCCEVLGQV